MGDTQEQAIFSGWAIVEVMGHRTVCGYATTKYFGPSAMIHVVQPEVAPQERILDREEWINSERCYPGTRVRTWREKAEAYIGAGSIYQLTPCTELQALKRQPETIEIIERVNRKQLPGVDNSETGRAFSDGLWNSMAEAADAARPSPTSAEIQAFHDELVAMDDPNDDAEEFPFEAGIVSALKWVLGIGDKPEVEPADPRGEFVELGDSIPERSNR